MGPQVSIYSLCGVAICCVLAWRTCGGLRCRGGTSGGAVTAHGVPKSHRAQMLAEVRGNMRRPLLPLHGRYFGVTAVTFRK